MLRMEVQTTEVLFWLSLSILIISKNLVVYVNYRVLIDNTYTIYYHNQFLGLIVTNALL